MTKAPRTPAPAAAQPMNQSAPATDNATATNEVAAPVKGGLAARFAQRKGPKSLVDFKNSRLLPRNRREQEAEQPAVITPQEMPRPGIPEGSRWANLRDRLFGQPEAETLENELTTKGEAEEEVVGQGAAVEAMPQESAASPTDATTETEKETEEQSESDAVEATETENASSEASENNTDSTATAAFTPEKETEEEETAETSVSETELSTTAEDAGEEETPPTPPEDTTNQTGKRGQGKPSAPKAADQVSPEDMEAAMAALEGNPGGAQEMAEIPAPTLETSDSGALTDSLTGGGVVSMAKGMENVGEAAAEAKANEKQTAKEAMPEIEQPTGLIPGEDQEHEKIVPPKAATPDLKNDGQRQTEEMDTSFEGPKTPVPGSNIAKTTKSSLNSWDGFMSRLDSLPKSDPDVQTNIGERPGVDLTGDADTAQNDKNEQEGEAEVGNRQSEADNATYADFGENNVYPTIEPEMLSPDVEMSVPEDWSSPEGGTQMPEMPAEVHQGVSPQLEEKYGARVEEEALKQDEEQAAYEGDVAEEQATKMAEIEEENRKAGEEQKAVRAEGREEIAGHREMWREENEAIKEEYQGKSEAEREKVDAQVETEVTQANDDVETKYAETEKENEAKQAEADQKVAKEQEEAEKKKDDKSWWDRVVDAVSDLFNALKEFVNKVFDELRAFVKKAIEAAKAFANKVIEAARKAVVGFIESFADALKGFVSFALAAFPEVAERINGYIDKAKDTAIAGVNAIAEGLKKAVNALLDALGAVIDAILAAYQALINALLDVLEFLTVGLIKIMQGIANLVISAGEVEPAFAGQISEELLGTDVTEPLENELPLPEADPTAATEAPGELDSMEAEGETADPATQNLMNRSSYSESDFEVSPAPPTEELSPELNAELAAKGDGEHEFGEAYGNPNGIEEIKGEMAPEPEATSETEETTATETAAEEPVMALPEMAPNGKPWVGPFKTTGERLSHVTSEMWTGISTWLSENWVLLVAGLIAGIVGIVAANILTGGAIMAALPLLMQLMSVFFAMDAMINLAKYFGNFLSLGWVGETVEAGKNLARGLAILLIELIFTLMFGAKGAFKAVKGGMKAAKGGMKGIQKASVKAIKGQVKQTKNLVKSTGQGLKKSGQKMVRNGKFVVGGIKKGAMKGAKSLDNLGKQLGKKLRFKKFKIVIKGMRFKLYGEMNPWVLLADGTVKEVPEGKFKNPSTGKTVTLDGQKGILFGKNNPLLDEDVAKRLIDDGFHLDDVVKLANSRNGVAIIEGLRGAKKLKSPEKMLEFIRRVEDANLDDQLGRLLGGKKLTTAKKFDKNGKLVDDDAVDEMYELIDGILNTGAPGKKRELDMLTDISVDGKRFQPGTQADVVDLDDQVIYQVKRVESDNPDQVLENINVADDQLAGYSQTGAKKQIDDEQPLPGFRRTSNVQIANPNNPMYSMDKGALKRAINAGVDNGSIKWRPSDLGGIGTQSMIIENNIGTFEFIISSSGRVK